MGKQWVVLLEASQNGASEGISRSGVARLLEGLDRGPHAGALHSPERYALQLTTAGASAPEALFSVVSRWRHLVDELGLPAWELVRTEVFTPEELERELQNHDREDLPIRVSSVGTPNDGDPSDELLRRAFSDPLTGLLTRDTFEHRLEDALTRTCDHGAVAVVAVALEGLRADEHFPGAMGDYLMLYAAECLAGTLRQGDSLGRVADDGFAILVEEATEGAALAVMDRALNVLHHPVTIQGHEVNLSASAGVALSEPGENAQRVLVKADAALASARRSDGGPHVVDAATGRLHRTPALLPRQPLDDRLAHLMLLQQVTVAANEADTLQQAAGVVLRQICSHVGCAIGHLWAPSAEASEVLLSSVWYIRDAYDYEAFQQASDALSFAPGIGLPGRVAAAGAPIWIADLAANPGGRRELSVAAGLASAFAFPVLVGPEVVAVFECFSRTPMEPSAAILDVLTAIGTQLGRVVERERAAAAMRRSQEQIRRSEAGLREAQAMASLGSWHFDVRTGEGTWSDEMYSLFGLDPTGSTVTSDSETMMASVHPDDRPRILAEFTEAVKSGERWATEIRIVRPEGHVRWHCFEGDCIRDDNGEVVAIHGTNQDITERKLMEQEHQARQLQLSIAQRVARLGWWELDMLTDRLTWSQEMYDLCGREPGHDLTSQDFYDMVHPDDRPRLFENMARIEQPSGTFHIESPWVDFRAFVSDGRERWFRVRIQLQHDEKGSPVQLAGTMQDITEEKLNEESLRTATELYQRILETAHEGILTLDAENTTTFVNPRLAQILGYAVEELLGLPASAFMDEDSQAALLGHDQRRGAGLSEQHETALRAKDGTSVQVLISASSLFDADGHFGGTLAMITDVSALRQAEDVVLGAERPLAGGNEYAPRPDGF